MTFLLGNKFKRGPSSISGSSETSSSKISAEALALDVESLTSHGHHRRSTRKTYHAVWQKFNKFVISLDNIPPTWEERVSLYCAQLINDGRQSSTLKSYISAIKSKLKGDGYKWNEDLVLFSALTKACKLQNDTVLNRFPISIGLLEIILFELDRMILDKDEEEKQYSLIMYRTLFLVTYYGLFRVGEVTASEHTIKAKDIHEAQNKSQYLIYLYTSKTHGKGDKPQKVKISPVGTTKTKKSNLQVHFFCPVLYIKAYLAIRRPYIDDQEQFFIHSNGQNVLASEMRKMLKTTLVSLQLNPDMYDVHSLRIGRATDMFKNGISVERIKKMGRWYSNAVYQYLRDYQAYS